MRRGSKQTVEIDGEEENLIGGGDNSQAVAAGQLRAFLERIERLLEDRKAINQDISDVYLEMKAGGWDTKTVKQVVRLRAMDQAEREEREAMLDLYKAALGMG